MSQQVIDDPGDDLGLVRQPSKILIEKLEKLVLSSDSELEEDLDEKDDKPIQRTPTFRRSSILSTPRNKETEQSKTSGGGLALERLFASAAS